jgi:hypothetical protein
MWNAYALSLSLSLSHYSIHLLVNLENPSGKYGINTNCILVKVKGKVHPITCHEGTDRVLRYSCTLSLTSALEKGGRSTPCPHPFPGVTQEKNAIPTGHEAGDPRTGLDGRRKSGPHRDSISRPSSPLVKHS